MEVAVSCMEVSTARFLRCCCPCCPCRASLGVRPWRILLFFLGIWAVSVARVASVVCRYRSVSPCLGIATKISPGRSLEGFVVVRFAPPRLLEGGGTTRSLARSLTRWPFSGWAKPEAFSERPGRQEQERPQGRPQGRLPPGVCGGRSFDVHAVPHQVRALLVDHRCLRSELVGARSRRSEPPFRASVRHPPPHPLARSLVFVRSFSLVGCFRTS